MKKLLFILAFIGCIPVFSQSYNWSGRLDLSEMSGTDTTIQPVLVGSGSKYTTDISGYGCSCTFEADSLTDTVSISLGGGNVLLSTGVYSYSQFASDSLPYDLIKANLLSVKNGDTVYIKDISLEPHVYTYSLPQVKVVKDVTDVTSILNWTCKFFKR